MRAANDTHLALTRLQTDTLTSALLQHLGLSPHPRPAAFSGTRAHVSPVHLTPQAIDAEPRHSLLLPAAVPVPDSAPFVPAPNAVYSPAIPAR